MKPFDSLLLPAKFPAISAVFLTVVVGVAMAWPIRVCKNEFLSLVACLNYISDPPSIASNSPSSECCYAFSSFFDNDGVPCLCHLLRKGEILGLPLNITRLHSLSSLCPLKNVDSATISLKSLCILSVPVILLLMKEHIEMMMPFDLIIAPAKFPAILAMFLTVVVGVATALPLCTNEFRELSHCLPYIATPPSSFITSNSASPECCDVFYTLFHSDNGVPCLCHLLWKGSLLDHPVNITRIHSLSSICSLKNVTSSTKSLKSLCVHVGPPTVSDCDFQSFRVTQMILPPESAV
ncbi:hypothetical protein HHK36_020591 [Tetracentron sinense]|uniref:Bifunctional inhibitor/plant lipid transfer protein/seed storage helical domain-containing protein n=1 Tax=Tetracentron sinense TaxID=13715 RepID=A0A835D857_TETSI|nr:hypothetical protein HHK36_020591 [Tetracentron sinense]